jgi:hypothetical protein
MPVPPFRSGLDSDLSVSVEGVGDLKSHVAAGTAGTGFTATTSIAAFDGNSTLGRGTTGIEAVNRERYAAAILPWSGSAPAADSAATGSGMNPGSTTHAAARIRPARRSDVRPDARLRFDSPPSPSKKNLSGRAACLPEPSAADGSSRIASRRAGCDTAFFGAFRRFLPGFPGGDGVVAGFSPRSPGFR